MHSGPVTFHGPASPACSARALSKAAGKLRLTNEPMPTAAMWWWVPPSAIANRSPIDSFTERTPST